VELGPPFKRGHGGHGGWTILDEPELHLQADILVPDLAGCQRERMPAMITDEPIFTLAPDWVAEILSLYGQVRSRQGAGRVVWLVDPLQRTLEVLRLADAGWSLRGTWRDDERARAEPFEAIELELGVLWADVVLPEG
jgi:Uma2 family endonuclease